MEVKMFNFWYFFWLLLSVCSFVGLYFILRKRKPLTQKIVLFSILVFAFILHFLKAYIPPYSTDQDRMYRDSWFINICGANIGLFPFLFFSKNKKVKDYMFYLGILGGLIAVVYPMEPIQKVDQLSEGLDIIRFYIHHHILWSVPLLMVMLGLHKLDYKRVWAVPGCFMVLLLFIMLNQIFQSELGFIPLRNDDIFLPNYKNSSYIWGPVGEDAISAILTTLCPEFFSKIPVGQYAGQTKYWPWFWLIFPAYIILIPVCFLICLIFDFKHFKDDMVSLKNKISEFINKIKEKKEKENEA